MKGIAYPLDSVELAVAHLENSSLSEKARVNLARMAMALPVAEEPLRPKVADRQQQIAS